MYRMVISLVIMLLVAIFSIQNKDVVNVNFLIWNLQIPLVILVISAATLGAVMVGLLGIVKQISMGGKIRELNGKLKKADEEKKSLQSKLEDRENQIEAQRQRIDDKKDIESHPNGREDDTEKSDHPDDSDNGSKQGILLNPTFPIR